MAKCDETLAAYNLLILDGVDVESKIREDCAQRRELFLLFRLLFLMWAAIAGQAALCLILQYGMPWFCEVLVTLALALLVTLLLIFLGAVALTLRMWANGKKCRDINKRLKDAYDAVKRDCPEERWPAELAKMKCDCD